ncbi:MAG: hypothetical protein Q9196_006025 [Gyalolechia fulgens]
MLVVVAKHGKPCVEENPSQADESQDVQTFYENDSNFGIKKRTARKPGDELIPGTDNLTEAQANRIGRQRKESPRKGKASNEELSQKAPKPRKLMSKETDRRRRILGRKDSRLATEASGSLRHSLSFETIMAVDLRPL